jgi:hypothetical protein
MVNGQIRNQKAIAMKPDHLKHPAINSVALDAILSIKGMPRRLSDRFDALEKDAKQDTLPRRGIVRH